MLNFTKKTVSCLVTGTAQQIYTKLVHPLEKFRLNPCQNPCLGQVKFVHLFKAVVLNLHVIMMKPEIKLIISAARLYWS